MRFSIVSILFALAFPLVHADDPKPLEIEYTHRVDCERKTVKNDRIDVHYRGTLTDGLLSLHFSLFSMLKFRKGKQFDASYDRNEPLTFVLGRGDVIKGWDEGLLDMCVGEKRKLVIQPVYGYGMRAVGPIPANSILNFDVELMRVHGQDHSHEEL